MAKRGIDMLPLLDVFMVVLFVFATIQEQQLDTSVQELDDTSAALAESEAERARLAVEAEALAAALAKLEASNEQQTEAEQELREQLAEFEAECGPRRPGGPACPAAAVNPDAKAQAAMASLQERLLDNIAVFEIEIAGDPDLTTGKITNGCCYRSTPPTGTWRECGVIPTDETELDAWISDGADGLVDGLGRTHGGNAVVLLSQRGVTSYRLSNALSDRLRERFPSYRIYDDGNLSGPPECPALTR